MTTLTSSRGAPTTLLAALVLVAALAVAGCGSGAASGPVQVAGSSDSDGYRGIYLDGLYRLPDVILTDTSDHPYNLESSPSRPVTLVFFGYTHCPDVCLAVLSNVAVALRRSTPATRDAIQMIFITTDPARDSPAANRAYLSRFDPDFIGLTGSLTTIKQVAAGMGVDIGDARQLPGGGYEVTHSTPVIGFDNGGRAQVLWTQETSPNDLRDDLALLVARQA